MAVRLTVSLRDCGQPGWHWPSGSTPGDHGWGGCGAGGGGGLGLGGGGGGDGAAGGANGGAGGPTASVVVQ